MPKNNFNFASSFLHGSNLMPKFNKKERLKSQKIIGLLFKKGNKLHNFPLTLIYLTTNSISENKIAFSVPKKKFKNASDRNKIKRMMREVYRIEKENFHFEMEQKNLALFLLFNSEKMPKYKELEKKIILLLNQLKKQIQND